MISKDIQYRCNTAAVADIFKHLQECDSRFVPALSLSIDLQAYANKIFAHAVRFEAWHEDRLVGLIATYFNDTVQAAGFITNVSVTQAYAGCGIASELMKQCIDYGHTLRFKSISLEVNRDNQKAIGLYEKSGFTESGFNNNSLILKHTLTYEQHEGL